MRITIRPVTPEVSAYLTAGGDWGFVRSQVAVESPGTPGFDGPVTNRAIVEAVFVAAEYAELAALVLTASLVPSLRTVFDARGIPYRLPWGVAAAGVTTLRRPAAPGANVTAA